MSDTPRTDKWMMTTTDIMNEIVPFARGLERENNKLREQLHRSMQLFGNLTLELKKNAAYRERLAVTEAAINEAGILENAVVSHPDKTPPL